MANSKRRCKYCKTYHPPAQMISNRLGFYCCNEHMIEDAIKNKPSLTEKGFKKRQREAKERIKKHSEWLQEAQAAFNRYVRVRDYGKRCISCNAKMDWNAYGGKVDAGHYRSVGGCSGGRFYLRNCFCQCIRCNRYLSGNVAEYRIALVKMYGEEEVAKIEALPKSRKYNIEYLKRVKRIFNKKATVV